MKKIKELYKADANQFDAFQRHRRINNPHYTPQTSTWRVGNSRQNYLSGHTAPVQPYNYNYNNYNNNNYHNTNSHSSPLLPKPQVYSNPNPVSNPRAKVKLTNERKASDRRNIQLRRTFTVSEPKTYLPPVDSGGSNDPGSSQFPSTSTDNDENDNSSNGYAISVSYSMGTKANSQIPPQEPPVAQIKKKARSSENFSIGPWKKGIVLEGVTSTLQVDTANTKGRNVRIFKRSVPELGFTPEVKQNDLLPIHAAKANPTARTALSSKSLLWKQKSKYHSIFGSKYMAYAKSFSRNAARHATKRTGTQRSRRRRLRGSIQSRRDGKVGRRRGRNGQKETKSSFPQIQMLGSPEFRRSGMSSPGLSRTRIRRSTHSSSPPLPLSFSKSQTPTGRYDPETETQATPYAPDAQNPQSNSPRVSSHLADISSHYAPESLRMSDFNSWDAKSGPQEAEEFIGISGGRNVRSERNRRGIPVKNLNRRRWIWHPYAQNYGVSYGYQPDHRFSRSYRHKYNNYNYNIPPQQLPVAPAPLIQQINPNLSSQNTRGGRNLQMKPFQTYQNLQNTQNIQNEIANSINLNPPIFNVSPPITLLPPPIPTTTFSTFDNNKWEPLTKSVSMPRPSLPTIPAPIYTFVTQPSKSLVPLGTFSFKEDAEKNDFERFESIEYVDKVVTNDKPYEKKLYQKIKKLSFPKRIHERDNYSVDKVVDDDNLTSKKWLKIAQNKGKKYYYAIKNQSDDLDVNLDSFDREFDDIIILIP